MKAPSGKIILKPEEKPKQKGNIILLENKKKEFTVEQGEVIDVCRNDDGVKPGDTVLYYSWNGEKMEDIISLKFKDVIAIVYE